MRTTTIFFVLVGLLAHEASGAESGSAAQNKRETKLERLQPVDSVADDVEEDSIEDLFISEGDTTGTSNSRVKSAGKKKPNPTFESWDVLRQYPRYDLIAEPQKNRVDEKSSTKSGTEKTKEKEHDVLQ